MVYPLHTRRSFVREEALFVEAFMMMKIGQRRLPSKDCPVSKIAQQEQDIPAPKNGSLAD